MWQFLAHNITANPQTLQASDAQAAFSFGGTIGAGSGRALAAEGSTLLVGSPLWSGAGAPSESGMNT